MLIMKTFSWVRAASLLVLLTISFGEGGAQQRPAVVVDKMVAVVNGDRLITLTDLLWQMALQPDTPIDGRDDTHLPPLQTALGFLHLDDDDNASLSRGGSALQQVLLLSSLACLLLFRPVPNSVV